MFFSNKAILYVPESWYDRQGFSRSPFSSFILVSKVSMGQGRGFMYAVPLNHVNCEDIFAKLPARYNDPSNDVAIKITERLMDLELRRRNFLRAESVKLAEGITDTRSYLFKDEDGAGYGPHTGELTKVGTDWDVYSPPGRKLYHQQRAVLDLVDNVDSALLAMQQRVGKTSPMVIAARHKYELGQIKLVLIVSTKRLLYTAWTDELGMYWPGVDSLIVSSDKDRENLLENHFPVVMTSFESLYKNWPVIRKLYDPSEVMLIADETIKIKSPTAKRTMAMYAACSEAKYRYLLSGAPVSRLHSDLFPQLMCVDPGLFGLNYTAAMEYFFQFYNDGSMRFRQGRKAMFHSITDYGLWRCTRGEAEQFKGKETVTINHRIKFHPLQAKLYRDLAEYMYAVLSDEEVTAAVSATNILVQLGRLREICGGFISYEFAPGKYLRVRLPVNPKISWLRGHYTSHETARSVIFCEYNEEEEMIADLLDEMKIPWGGQLAVKRERKAGQRVGSVDQQFAKHIAEFQNYERQVFLGKHSSIGHGLTLNTAEEEIFYSLGFNSDNYDQARMRAVGGGKDTVLVHHLLMGGSLEETKVYVALRNRQDMKTVVLKDAKRKGHSSFFEELSIADLLINDEFGGGAFDDFLEVKAREVLRYDGPLDREALKQHAASLGHGLFATIKNSIGSAGSLKEAFKKIALNFHPDKAVQAGHDKSSPMYMLYNRIMVQANAARENSTSLGDFIATLGGKEVAPDWQMYYDYLLRKCPLNNPYNDRQIV